MMPLKNTIILITLTLHLSMNGQKVDCLIGDSLLNQQNYMLAAIIYTSCYLSDTIDKKPMVSLANCYMQLGDYTLAKKYYHQLEVDSLYKIESISKLAIIYESQQNLPKAIKYYRAISMVYPENPIYLRKLGNLYLQGRETKQALESYQKAYQINPRDLLTIQGLTEFYLNGDDLGKADSLANNGIKIDSNNVGLLLLKSRIRYRARDYSTTAEILHKLTYQTELNNFYNKLLGYSFIQIDSIDKAIYHLQKSLLDENDPEYALFYLALAHEKKKEFSKAEWFFQEAAKAGISDNMSQYHRGLARIYTHQQAHSKVIDHYQKSLEYQADPEVYFFMGNAAEQMSKRKNKAIQYYQQYLKSGHKNDEWRRISTARIKVLKENEFMNKTKK